MQMNDACPYSGRPPEWVPARVALRAWGVSKHDTLARWANEGLITSLRLPNGHRRYDLNSVRKATTFTQAEARANAAAEIERATAEASLSQERVNYVYARVSSYKQRKDLGNQVSFLKTRFPNHTLIKDFGSGLNFKRKGLRTLLERARQGRVGDVVVAHKDRLCRFAFELVEWVVTSNGGRVVVLDQTEHSPQEEFTEDLLSIVHVFSSRYHGLRRYRNAAHEATAEGPEPDKRRNRKRQKRSHQPTSTENASSAGPPDHDAAGTAT